MKYLRKKHIGKTFEHLCPFDKIHGQGFSDIRLSFSQFAKKNIQLAGINQSQPPELWAKLEGISVFAFSDTLG